MKRVYLVRHCQAEGQAPDAPLTAEGRKQAERLADLLADRAIGRILSSPYERAVRSAAPLAERLALPVETDARLTERVLTTEPRSEWRDMLRRTFDEPDLCFAGGESSRTAADRIYAVLTEVLHGVADNVVIVSHGNIVSLLLGRLDGRFGFDDWAAMTNPDVYRLALGDGAGPVIERIRDRQP